MCDQEVSISHQSPNHASFYFQRVWKYPCMWVNQLQIFSDVASEPPPIYPKSTSPNSRLARKQYKIPNSCSRDNRTALLIKLAASENLRTHFGTFSGETMTTSVSRKSDGEASICQKDTAKNLTLTVRMSVLYSYEVILVLNTYTLTVSGFCILHKLC